MSDDHLEELLHQVVVIDTDSQFIHIGTLAAITPTAVLLTDVDIHYMSDAATSREVYLMESAKFGVRANRKKTTLMRSKVLSVSLLEDVIQY